jgi:hypothetical protein
MRYQITAPSDAPFGVFGWLFGDGSSVADYLVIDFHEDMIQLDDGGQHLTLAEDDFTDGFHTVRVAQPAGGGDGDTHMWVDSQLVANNITAMTVAGLTRTWLGNRTNQWGGQALVDWIRIDNTGGFAPDASAFTPGDFNTDGNVDTADYTIWADNYTGSGGSGGTASTGDANGDGAVDTADYTIWADNYTGASAAASTVPEPGLPILVLGAILIFYSFRSRKEVAVT